MLCTKCGNENPETNVVCNFCGNVLIEVGNPNLLLTKTQQANEMQNNPQIEAPKPMLEKKSIVEKVKDFSDKLMDKMEGIEEEEDNYLSDEELEAKKKERQEARRVELDKYYPMLTHNLMPCDIPGNTLPFYIVNGIILLSMFVGTMIAYGSHFLMALSLFNISAIWFLTPQLLLMKAKKPWWAVFVPIYGEYLMYEIMFGNGLVMVIPLLTAVAYPMSLYSPEMGLLTLELFGIINGLLGIVGLFMLGRRFGKSGLITVLIGLVFIPVIAFSGHAQYDGMI